MSWIVVQTKKNKEVAVMEQLRSIGFEALVPREEQQIRTSGEWETKERILFPGYVFTECKFDASVYYKIMRISGVSALLGSPRTPATLSYLESEWIRLLGNDGKMIEPTLISFQDDGSYLIKKGILLNFKSRIISCQKRQKKATFEITVFDEIHKITLSIITDEKETSEN